MQVTQTQTATYTVINQVTTTTRPIVTVNPYPRRSFYGTAGDDHITGNLGDDIIQGGDGNDIINGGQGADDISGGYGNDRIWGGIGNDNISGGAGRDVLLGGEGDDRESLLGAQVQKRSRLFGFGRRSGHAVIFQQRRRWQRPAFTADRLK